jgi:hypothetical protein
MRQPLSRMVSSSSRLSQASCPVVMAAATPPSRGPSRSTIRPRQRPAKAVDGHDGPQPGVVGSLRVTSSGGFTANPTPPMRLK